MQYRAGYSALNTEKQQHWRGVPVHQTSCWPIADELQRSEVFAGVRWHYMHVMSGADFAAGRLHRLRNVFDVQLKRRALGAMRS